MPLSDAIKKNMYLPLREPGYIIRFDWEDSLRGHNGWNYDIPPDLIIPIELFRSHIRSIDTISMNTQAEENKILGTL